MSSLVQFILNDLRALAAAVSALAVAALVFAALARLTKPKTWIADGRASVEQSRINLTIALLDVLFVAPLLGLLAAQLAALVQAHGAQLHAAPLWRWIGPAAVAIVAIVLGDFIGYWRHRAQHSKWLWPAHAIHHSDTHLTWLSLERMHPVDRLGTMLDGVILAMLGVPPWAVALNGLVRHYYGYVIHADLQFTGGKAGWILNSPVMHRWHHARDVDGSGSNFATVFSVFDRAFGTYYAPGPCTAPLGVREDMGRGVLGQYAHPFKIWWRVLAPRRAREVATAD